VPGGDSTLSQVICRRIGAVGDRSDFVELCHQTAGKSPLNLLLANRFDSSLPDDYGLDFRAGVGLANLSSPIGRFCCICSI
jgi:hypothetical protein